MEQALAPIVVKVGGSLYDLPDLAGRLRSLLRTLEPAPVLLVPGGGIVIEAIRELDRVHQLGEEASHWLALRALNVNAHFLLHLLQRGRLVAHPDECKHAWAEEPLVMLDPHGFALWDEKNPDRLPRCWSVTSDSIAARAAVLVGAGRLILLKSREGSIKEVVDAHFLGVVGKGVTVEVVNGRAVKN